MKLSVNTDEIIRLDEFELSWRWQKSHNETISNEEKELLLPLSEIESKRLFIAIEHWIHKIENSDDFSESDWMMASSESDLKIRDDTTIISTELNWMLAYSHYGVANIWKANELH